MLQLEGAARYADVLETALYNGVLPGLSLDGLGYFYVNPLTDDGNHRRQPWYNCACCPPNIARLLASLTGYYYSVDHSTIWVHLYAESTARLTLPDGRTVSLAQHTRYPWAGEGTIEVAGEGTFGLRLRVPAWCEEGASLTVNGQLYDGAVTPGTYVEVRRAWQPGDVVRLNLPMPVRRVEAHPYALENAGRVALMRGPLVYCLEGVDHPSVDLRDVVLPTGVELSVTDRPDLLGGVVALSGSAEIAPPDAGWPGHLYRTAKGAEPAPRQPIALTAIPYYAWANRAAGAMQVWLREIKIVVE